MISKIFYLSPFSSITSSNVNFASLVVVLQRSISRYRLGAADLELIFSVQNLSKCPQRFILQFCYDSVSIIMHMSCTVHCICMDLLCTHILVVILSTKLLCCAMDIVYYIPVCYLVFQSRLDYCPFIHCYSKDS